MGSKSRLLQTLVGEKWRKLSAHSGTEVAEGAACASHIEDRLLQPERLGEILASVLDRRQERTERRREHIAELTQRAAETDLRLKRLSVQ